LKLPQGGHANTYFDPDTNMVYDYGVQAYFGYEDALDFFVKVNVTLVENEPRISLKTRYVDFSTGEELKNYHAPDSKVGMNAVRKFYDLIKEKGYDKMTEPGYWILPPGDEIPEDLLMPIGELVKKYGIEEMLAQMYPSTGGGVGSLGRFEDVMTLTVMKSFPAGWIPFFVGDIPGIYHVEGGNQQLYDAIADILGPDVLYSSMVVDAERSENEVKLVVQGEGADKLIIAKKLLIAIHPTRQHMQPFDLNEDEQEIFSKPQYGRSHIGIGKHSKLPSGTYLRNMPSSAVENPLAPFLKPPLCTQFSHYGEPSRLFRIGTGGDDYDTFTMEVAQAKAQEALEKMAAAGVLPDLEGEQLEIVAWSDHGAGGFGVSPGDMRNGWMADLYGLQGKRATWYTGGAIAADFTTMLWKFNDDLLRRIMADM
jgi:hypothetical protein